LRREAPPCLVTRKTRSRGYLHGRNPSSRRATYPSLISRARSLRHEPNAIRFVRAHDPVGGYLAPWEIRQICDELGRLPELEYHGGEPDAGKASSSACPDWFE
jgi:hypothetical protein